MSNPAIQNLCLDSSLRILQASQAEDPEVLFHLGLACQFELEGFPRSSARAWFQRAWNARALALFEVGPGESFWKDALWKDFTSVQFEVGKQDRDRAKFPFATWSWRRWYQRLEIDPSIRAAWGLAEMLRQEDHPDAEVWIRRAAWGGLPEAMFVLARQIFESPDCDPVAAQRWESLARIELEPLAHEGSPESQYQLGVLLLEGRGGEKDLLRAAHWFRCSAKSGHRESLRLLGEIRVELEAQSSLREAWVPPVEAPRGLA